MLLVLFSLSFVMVNGGELNDPVCGDGVCGVLEGENEPTNIFYCPFDCQDNPMGGSEVVCGDGVCGVLEGENEPTNIFYCPFDCGDAGEEECLLDADGECQVLDTEGTGSTSNVISLGTEEICLLSVGGECQISNIRLEGDMRGLVRLNEGTGIYSVLGEFATMRSIIGLIDPDGDLPGFDDPIPCGGARLCGYEVGCKVVSDGICPEHYGDWEEKGCNENNYGSRCFPCDPDCDDTDCGQMISVIAPNIKYDDISLVVKGTAIGYQEYGKFFLHSLRILDGRIDANPLDISGDIECDLIDEDEEGNEVEEYYICSHNFDTEVQGDVEPTDSYWFGVGYMSSQNGEDWEVINFVSDCGIISPSVEIDNHEGVLEGDIVSTATILGGGGLEGYIGEVVFFIFKEIENEEGGEAEYVRVDTLCGFNRQEGEEYTCSWDTSHYENGDYKLDVMAVGHNINCFNENSPYVDSIDITIENEPIPIPFKILNIILAKIKTWL